MDLMDKPISELTEEELEEGMQELRSTSTPEEWAQLLSFASVLNTLLLPIAKPDTMDASSAELASVLGDIPQEQLLGSFSTITETIAGYILEDADAFMMTPGEFFRSENYKAMLKKALEELKEEQPNEWEGGDEGETSHQETVEKMLPVIKAFACDKFVFVDNLFMNKFTVMELGKKNPLRNVCGDKFPDIVTWVTLVWKGEDIELTGKKLTNYDKGVLDTLVTIYRSYGRCAVTLAQIWRVMVHAENSETPSQQQLKELEQSIEKMRYIKTTIHCKAELTQRLNQKPPAKKKHAEVARTNELMRQCLSEGGKLGDMLICVMDVEIETGGHTTKGYLIKEWPLVYEYGRMTNQVKEVEIDYLDIISDKGKKISNSKRRLAVKFQLLRRVERMKGSSADSQSRKIRYDDLYANIDDINPSEKVKRMVREYALQVLDYWKRVRYIKGYREYKEGNKKVGVSLSV